MRNRLLHDLKEACSQGDDKQVAIALQSLLAWLTLAENNNDSNCKAVDAFVCTSVLDALRPDLSEELRAVLFDVGGQLHDTHSSPEVARNFASTPLQLLCRLRQHLSERK